MPDLATTCSCDGGWIVEDGVAVARCTSCAGRRPAAAAGAAEGLAGGKLRRLDIAAMRCAPPPPVDWIVDGLVARANVTLLAGREGLGKSLLSAAIAAALARGGDTVAGMRCRGAGVVILDAENGPQEVARRAHALDLGDQGVTYLEPAAGEFDLVDDYPGLRDVVQAAAPSLVVLDSLRTLWHGDEYIPREGARVAELLSRLARACDCGVLVLHGVSRSSGEYSGNTALGHGVQLVFTMRREQHDQQQGRRVLRCHKARVGREPGDRWLTIEHQDDRVAFVRADPVGAKHPAARGSNGSTVEPTEPDALALTLGAVVKALADGPLSTPELAAAVGRSPKDGTLRRAINDGLSQGRVVRVHRGKYDLGPGSEPLEPTEPNRSGSNGSGATEPWSQAAEGGLGSNGSAGSNRSGSNSGSGGSSAGPLLRVVRGTSPAQSDMEARP